MVSLPNTVGVLKPGVIPIGAPLSRRVPTNGSRAGRAHRGAAKRAFARRPSAGAPPTSSCQVIASCEMG